MKKLLSILVLATLANVIFAGGSGDQATKKKPVELSFFSWYSTETDSFEDVLLKDLAEQAPGVTIEIEPVVWDKMHSLLQARIAGGTMPDLLDFKGQDISKYGSAGNLLDLTGSPWLKAVPEAARENLKVGGKEYGVPYSALFQGVLYNRAVFEKYGLKPPATYDELMAVAKTLKSKGVVPFATHFADNWNIGNITMQFAMSEVFSENPAWGTDLYAGKASFEKSEGYRRVFEHVKDLYENTWNDTYRIDFTEATNRFAKGEAAMFVTGTWINRNLKEFPSFDYGIFPFPGKKAGARLIFEPNHTWAIAATTANPDAAKEVLKAILADKGLAKTFVDEAGAYSLLLGVTPSEPYPCDRDIDSFKAANRIVDVSVGNNQIKWAYQEEYSRYITEWLLGKKTLDEALSAATLYKAQIAR